jgi:3-hydroxyacyl-CoA dehydrogenase/enoyl-CoA hydratase/3-hydroxybutyryl-CoA epimerase
MTRPAIAQHLPASLYGHPVAAALLDEALALLGEGVPALDIEEAGRALGLPVGPLAILDALSLKVVDEALHAEGHGPGHAHGHEHAHGHAHSPAHVHGPECRHEHGHGHTADPVTLHPSRTAHQPPHDAGSPRLQAGAIHVVEKMAHGYRRAGRDAGAGFYDYEGSGPPVLWSGLRAFERRRRSIAPQDVGDRLLFAALLAAVRTSAPAARLETVFGPAFPADAVAARAAIAARGMPTFSARARELADRYGPRFMPPPDPLAATHG